MSDEPKEYNAIPTSKVQRAMKVLGTGMKVGGNYIAHYSKSIVKSDVSKEALHTKNAEAVIETLGEMKGSALKMAQMLSMDEFSMPESYQKAFQQAQHNAPPLSFPLIQKTIRTQLNADTEVLFDTFSRNALHAASIGQVHQATKDGKKLAVKIQYPGVADSIESDIKLMRPIAQRAMHVSAKELDFYLDEVKQTMLEETDYTHELKMALTLKEQCAPLTNLIIPAYHKELSSKKVLTMDWIEGELLYDWLATNPSESSKQKIAQTLWDTFLFQIQELGLVHADPHPGNFIVTPEEKLCLIDFGCVKPIESSFYQAYFQMLLPEVYGDDTRLIETLNKLDFFTNSDSEEDKHYLLESLKFSIEMLAVPFQTPTFNFGSWDYMKGIHTQGEQMAKEIRKRKITAARGPKEAIYLLRTFYGLYAILGKIGQTVTLNYDIKSKLV